MQGFSDYQGIAEGYYGEGGVPLECLSSLNKGLMLNYQPKAAVEI